MYALVKYNTSITLDRPLKASQMIALTEGGIGVISMCSKQIEQLKEQCGVSYVEPEFEIQLRGGFTQPISNLDNDTLVGYIGYKTVKDDENTYYDLDTQTFVNRPSRYVIGISKNKVITSTLYLGFICDMICKSLEEHKKLLIYADIYIVENSVRYRSLLNKTINELLEKVNGILVNKLYGDMASYYTPCSKKFEAYIEKTIYTEDTFNQVLKKMKPIEDRNHFRSVLKKIYREAENEGLYNNIFYEQISEDETIYVPILPTSIVPRDAYESLGVEYIKIDRGYGILRGEKKIFDREKDFLINNVIPQYDVQILTPVYLTEIEVPSNYQLNPRENQTYNGEGVYIGIVGVSGIDYRNANFIDQEGRSRVSYVWDQIEGGKGQKYLNKEIQQALEKNIDLDIYSKLESYLTSNLLAIAGGKTNFNGEEYKGVASEAEFIVAKINRAPDTLQKIYVGGPTEEAVLLDDVIIGINQLVEFANEQKKPLVLCIPYGSNLNSHDGKSILESRIETFASQTGIAMIVSAGEEADKAHHSRITLEKSQGYTVGIEISDNQQKVVGVIWINDINIVDITLVSPSSRSYNLNKTGRYVENSSEILISGVSVDFDNGLKEIMFSIENLTVGRWQIDIIEKESSKQGTYENVIDIWLSQQSLNKHVTLRPYDVFVTIPGIGNIPNIISVGNYDNETLTIYKSSGRGYTRQNLVKPTLVAQGKDVLSTTQEGKWGLLTGSAAAMANMTGVVAALYSKLVASQMYPLPNTAVISSMLISQLTLLATVQYPNPSQGNGIFDRKAMKNLLDKDSPISIGRMQNGRL